MGGVRRGGRGRRSGAGGALRRAKCSLREYRRRDGYTVARWASGALRQSCGVVCAEQKNKADDGRLVRYLYLIV